MRQFEGKWPQIKKNKNKLQDLAKNKNLRTQNKTKTQYENLRISALTAVSVRARTQRANLSLPLSKAHPILGSTERI